MDQLVCTIATASRGLLTMDQRNVEEIGEYAVGHLIQKIPLDYDQAISDDSLAAVLIVLDEVIKNNAKFSRSLLDAGGVERLINITHRRQIYGNRVNEFANKVLFSMWQYQELRDIYKKHGWEEQDFVIKTSAAQNVGNECPERLECPICKHIFTRGYNLNAHLKLKHSENIIKYKCIVPSCKSTFAEKSGVKKHFTRFHNGKVQRKNFLKYNPKKIITKNETYECFAKFNVDGTYVLVTTRNTRNKRNKLNNIKVNSINSLGFSCPISCFCFSPFMFLGMIRKLISQAKQETNVFITI